jgi:hypothetical protein
VDGHEGRGSVFSMVFPGARASGEEHGQAAA